MCNVSQQMNVLFEALTLPDNIILSDQDRIDAFFRDKAFNPQDPIPFAENIVAMPDDIDYEISHEKAQSIAAEQLTQSMKLIEQQEKLELIIDRAAKLKEE